MDLWCKGFWQIKNGFPLQLGIALLTTLLRLRHLKWVRHVNHGVKTGLTLYRMGLFRVAHGGGWAKRSPSPIKSFRHILQWWTWHSHTLTRKDPKKYMNHVTHPLSFADTSIFHWKSANFATSENTDIDSILVHNFSLF